MRIACAFDHAGLPLREPLVTLLTEAGHEVIDLGTDSPEPVDYPDKALDVARALMSGGAERGVLACGSGAGVAIAASKVPGIRAACAHDTYTAHQGVEHDDVNVLCLGARVIGPALAEDILRAFVAARFSGEDRHRRRLAKVEAIERGEGARVSVEDVPALTVAADPEGAAEACAELLARLIDAARAERGEVHLSLAGGDTPRRAYELLADRLGSWRGVHLWYGDERVSEPSAGDSNHAMVSASLLTAAGVPPDQVHRVPVEHGARDAATLYADALRASVPAGPGAVPTLDVALLGLGPDGHTASLFPGNAAVAETEALCAPVFDAPKPPPERVTMTVPTLRAARRLIVLTTGPEKRPAVEALLSGPDPAVPVSLVVGVRADVIVDADAAPEGDLEGPATPALHHVALEIRAEDGDACRDFYALLGFAEVRAPEGLAGRTRWLERGAQQVHLMFVEAPTAVPSGHLAVVMDHYEAGLSALRSAGHEVDPRVEHWGSPRAFTRDPAGHRVELMAFPPGVISDGPAVRLERTAVANRDGGVSRSSTAAG